MALNDVLSDVVSIIKNGQHRKFQYVFVKSSSLVKAVLDVLQREGYIASYKEFEDRKNINMIKVDLKYYNDDPVISVFKRESTPGRRVYSNVASLKKFYGGLGISIISTSQGVMSDDEARKQNIGGEVLCYVY